MKTPSILLAPVITLAAIMGANFLSAQQATPKPSELDAIAQQAFSKGPAPGMAISVEHQGKVVFAKGYGFADLVNQTPAKPETRFAVGSVSKQFVAVSILMLSEQGKLSLDDPLGNYLPQFPNAPRITVRMLLNQTSGLHNYPNTNEHPWPLQGNIDPAKLFAIMAKDKSDFEPGTKWEYSNTNYAALAEIVSKVSGLSFASFLKRNIFDPLGMASSGSGFNAQSGIARAYKDADPYQPQQSISLDLSLGAGSVVSTVADLARWDDALLRSKLLTPASMHLLWTNATLPNGESTNYAMGFVATTLDGHRELWHNGFTPGAGGYCFNAIFPDDGLSIAVLSNGAKFKGVPEAIVRQTLNAFFPAAPGLPEDRTSTQTEAVKEDPAVTALALKLYRQFMAGTLDTSLLTAEAAAAFTPPLLAQVQPTFAQLGEPEKLVLQTRQSTNGGTAYTYLATFASADLHLVIFIAADGRVGGYRLKQ